jgi:hypothetical protein
MLTVIPIVGIGMGGILVFFYLFWRHRQHMKMIENGMQPPQVFDLMSFSLVAGLVTSGVGLVLAVFFVLTDGSRYSLLGGLIPLAVGIGLVVFYMLRQNEPRR